MTTRAIVPPPVPSAPPLQPGDHLTRDEFERRFDATPGLKRAELIEGVVYMPPALRWDYHAHPDAHLVRSLRGRHAGSEGRQ